MEAETKTRAQEIRDMLATIPVSLWSQTPGPGQKTLGGDWQTPLGSWLEARTRLEEESEGKRTGGTERKIGASERFWQRRLRASWNYRTP